MIGPLLFLVLIGDIDKDICSAFLSSFADDTRVGHGIASPDDANLLQEDLKRVYSGQKKTICYSTASNLNCYTMERTMT